MPQIHRLKTNNNLHKLFSAYIGGSFLLEGLIIRHIYVIKMYNFIICESVAIHFNPCA